jgi:hypothetical protein
MSKTMPWIRLYVEVLDDPKIGLLPGHLKWPWIQYLLATEKNGGTLPLMLELSYMLRRPVEAIKDELEALVEAGLLDYERDGTLRPHNWGGRQYRSDKDVTAASRKQAERARKKVTGDNKEGGHKPVTRDTKPPVTGGGTEMSQPPDTESDTEAEQKQTPESPSNEGTPTPPVETLTRGEDSVRKAHAVRAHRLPLDWRPSDRNIADAAKRGVVGDFLTDTVEGFKDWAKGSPKAVKLDWDATWRTWVKRVEFERNNHPRPPNGAVVTFKPKPPPRIALSFPAMSDIDMIRLCTAYRNRNEWDRAILGPAPGETGCMVARKLIEAAGIKLPPIRMNYGNGKSEIFDLTPSQAGGPDQNLTEEVASEL